MQIDKTAHMAMSVKSTEMQIRANGRKNNRLFKAADEPLDKRQFLPIMDEHIA